MVKDSISYIEAAEETSNLEDSLHQDIYRMRQVPMGDTANLSSSEPLYIYYSSKNDSKADRHEGIPLPFALEQTDGIFGLILVCFLVFTHVYQGGFTFLKENIRILFSPEKSKNRYGQATVKEVWYTYFLIFQTIALVSICLYDVAMKLEPLEKDMQTPFVTVVAFIILISVFIFLKIGLYRFLGYIFDFKTVMSGWIRSYTTVLEILGIFSLIPTLLLIYSDYLHVVGIAFILILFLLAQLILFYRIIVFFIREKFNFLFLIAYLCTIEILPYVFLSIGLIYLYRFDVYSILWLLK
ncbi:MAG: DUF4271 domain-containing protein [Dysgonomonas sp.]